MEILQVVGLGLVAGSILLVLRQQRPELAMLLSLAAGAVIFLAMLDRVLAVVETLESLGQRARVETPYLATVLRIIGIAYLADFGSQVLSDAGEKAVAAKVEMAGKVLILILALPVLLAILDTLLQMLA
ncbi:MAG: stage III sporulation protein AD [Firmicutes bacterium]|nr:stage III sporulation protein AD [Bacillota bacterium]